jgi:hypothetical protein
VVNIGVFSSKFGTSLHKLGCLWEYKQQIICICHTFWIFYQAMGYKLRIALMFYEPLFDLEFTNLIWEFNQAMMFFIHQTLEVSSGISGDGSSTKKIEI